MVLYVQQALFLRKALIISLFIKYISWISDGELAWTLRSAGMAADTRVEIAARPVPQEPMVSFKMGAKHYALTSLKVYNYEPRGSRELWSRRL